MGARTALLAYAAEDPVESLRHARESDPAAAHALVAATHPAWEGTASSDGDLLDGCYPPEGTVYAGSFPGIDILCDRDVMDYLPSGFPARYLGAAVEAACIYLRQNATQEFIGIRRTLRSPPFPATWQRWYRS